MQRSRSISPGILGGGGGGGGGYSHFLVRAVKTKSGEKKITTKTGYTCAGHRGCSHWLPLRRKVEMDLLSCWFMPCGFLGPPPPVVAHPQLFIVTRGTLTWGQDRIQSLPFVGFVVVLFRPWSHCSSVVKILFIASCPLISPSLFL